MAAAVSAAEVAVFREVFSFYGADGVLPVARLAEAVRSLGYCPTEAEMRTLESVVVRMHNSTMDFDTFVALLATHVIPKQRSFAAVGPKVAKAFRVFNQMCRGEDRGVVSVLDFVRILSERGDVLDEAALRELLQTVEVDGRVIHMDDILKTLAPCP